MPRTTGAMSEATLRKHVLAILATETGGDWKVVVWGAGEIRLVNGAAAVEEDAVVKCVDECVQLCGVRAVMHCPASLMRSTLTYHVSWQMVQLT